MTLHRVNATWTGLPGLPGLSTFYLASLPTEANMTAIRQFFVDVADRIAAGVTIQLQNSGTIIDETTGAVTGLWGPTAAQLPVASSGISTYAAPAGAMCQWNTAGIVHNRIVRGRTFLVPLGTTVYDASGNLTTVARDDFVAAAAALVVALGTGFRIWSRPFSGSPTIPARSGSQHAVISSTVPDKAVVLRSRRD